jgi:glycogen(starch) synthase
MPGLRLVIAGDGAARSSLEALAVELGIRDCVDFLGWVTPDRVPALVNGATLVVMPSRREGLPGVALEAALMARPVVGTTVGGFPEIVLHQKTGLLVGQDDQEALAAAILYLLTHRAMATAFGQAARRRAQEVFSFERYVDAYDALYRKILIRRGQTPKDLPVGPPALT